MRGPAATALIALRLLMGAGGAGGAGAPTPRESEEDPKPRQVDTTNLPGPFIDYEASPPPVEARACSPRVPVCIHGSARDPALIPALAAFERGWETLTQALSVPPPDVDRATLAYDVWLVEPGPILRGGLSSTRMTARDVRSRVDRARAVTFLDRRVRAGCQLDALAAEAVARASLYRSAPATEEATARAQSRYLAELVAPCAIGLSLDAVEAFQTHPERTFCDSHAMNAARDPHSDVPDDPGLMRANALFAAGAASFWARLDWAFGRVPGGIVTAAWALSPTMTQLGSPRWLNEPDSFDVLRMTFKGALSTKGTVHDLWLDFGIARAFVGKNDDGYHLPELRAVDLAGRVTTDWDVPWPDKPRRLAARIPVRPTGSSYLVIHRAGAKPGARLRAEIEWEEHALFRWAFVKLDADGRELGRIVIPTTERATQAQMTLVDVDRADRILLVGVNVGDPAYAFDPDDVVWEPHGWLVTIAEE